MNHHFYRFKSFLLMIAIVHVAFDHKQAPSLNTKSPFLRISGGLLFWIYGTFLTDHD